jgi:hypothetical protein
MKIREKIGTTVWSAIAYTLVYRVLLPVCAVVLVIFRKEIMDYNKSGKYGKQKERYVK